MQLTSEGTFLRNWRRRFFLLVLFLHSNVGVHFYPAVTVFSKLPGAQQDGAGNYREEGCMERVFVGGKEQGSEIGTDSDEDVSGAEVWDQIQSSL